MHLQVKCRLTKSGSHPPGARDIDEDDPGVTVVRPGRLLHLLELLAADRTEDPRDGHGPFNLTSAAGSGIETTGTFMFTIAAHPDREAEEYRAAYDRIKGQFSGSEIVERRHARLAHHEGALAEYVASLRDEGLLIDEIVLGVAGPDPDAGGEITVPIQVHAIRAV